MRNTFLFIIIFVLIFPIYAKEQAKPARVYFKEKVVAGSPQDFMQVRHIVLKGSNCEIGRKIAEIAKKDNIKITPAGDPVKNKVQLRYIKENFPLFFERMRGAADVYGIDINNSAYYLSFFNQDLSHSGCSVVFYPPRFTASASGILSRNYDFTTGNFQGKRPLEGELNATSRPIIFEIYPDRGYPSLFICAYDLLGGVIDGINSEGLTVAILAEEESLQKGLWERDALEIGLHELASMRYLLDLCKDTREAKEALLYLKHYYFFIPCHYIVADRFGHSFIFEFSMVRNKTLISEGKGPQCITNHLVALHPSVDQLPAGNSFNRYRTLYKATHSKKKFTLEEIKSINAKVAAAPFASGNPEIAPTRTLWHALYNTKERSLTVKFYLGETPHPTNKESVILRYSDYLTFRLK